MATGHYVEFPEIRLLAEMADLEFQGNEHNVLAFTKGKHPFVIRLTKLDMFGLPGRTPAEYLQRWRLSNAAFPDAAVSFLAYTRNSRGNGVILTSQPYLEGIKKSQKAIDRAFDLLGFQSVPGEPTSYLNPHTEVEIHDAKPDNVLFDPQGNMLPFDVWINDPTDTFGLR